MRKLVLSMVFVISIILSIFCLNVYAEGEYTDDLCTDPTKASASSSYSNLNELVSRLFNNGIGDYRTEAWESELNPTYPQWIKYDFGIGNEKKIQKYTITRYADLYTNTSPNWMIKDFVLQGSNNDVDWISVETPRTNESNWTPNEKREYTLTNNTAYRYYRLLITANNGEPLGCLIDEIEMMEKASSIPTVPTNITALTGNAKVDLSWSAVTGATSYNVKRAITAGGPYTTIATNITTTTYLDTTVTNGTTYYYVVTAVNAGGESGNSNEASATPTAPTQPTGGPALLVITMTNGTEKEYEMTGSQITAFIDWYNDRASGSGTAYYVINKNYNKGPFTNRKDYIVFDKILNFEVMEY